MSVEYLCVIHYQGGPKDAPDIYTLYGTVKDIEGKPDFVNVFREPSASLFTHFSRKQDIADFIQLRHDRLKASPNYYLRKYQRVNVFFVDRTKIDYSLKQRLRFSRQHTMNEHRHDDQGNPYIC